MTLNIQRLANLLSEQVLEKIESETGKEYDDEKWEEASAQLQFALVGALEGVPLP